MMYRIGPAWSGTLEQAEDVLGKVRFVECGATQEKSAGWIEPRGVAHGPLVESIGGQWIMKFMIEVKIVPGSVIGRKTREKLAQIEAETGRKPGRKETKEIKDEIHQTLLPMAFTKQASFLVWIDPVARLLMVDASSPGKADEVITSLVEQMDGLALTMLQTNLSASTAMSQWLVEQEAPAGFTVDRECELKATDESKSAVRYSKHPLDIEEVRQHIEVGKLPTKLAMTWDDRVSFLLTENLQIKKLAFLDAVYDGQPEKDDKDFDADAAIATGEMRRLIPDLVEALGGEVVAA